MNPFPTIPPIHFPLHSLRWICAFSLILAVLPFVISAEEGALPFEGLEDSGAVTSEEGHTKPPPTTPLHRYALLEEPIVFKPLRDFGTKISVRLLLVNNEKNLQLQYDLRRGTRVSCFAGMKANLARCERFRLVFQGDGPANTLQIQLTVEDGSTVSYSWPDGTNSPHLTATEIPLSEMRHFPGGDGFSDWTRVTSIQFNITNANAGQGGRGIVTFKETKIY